MKICAWSSEVCTHCPSPERRRSCSATRMPERREEPGGEIGERDAGAHRAAAGLAGDRHEARHALRDLVDAGPVAIGPVLAEAGDAGIDEARIDAP